MVTFIACRHGELSGRFDAWPVSFWSGGVVARSPRCVPLLFITAPLDRGDLMLVRPDGSETRPLTNKSGYGTSGPSWQRLPS